MKVVVAGASGFIGRRLGARLGEACHLIGLSRSARAPGAATQSIASAICSRAGIRFKPSKVQMSLSTWCTP